MPTKLRTRKAALRSKRGPAPLLSPAARPPGSPNHEPDHAEIAAAVAKLREKLGLPPCEYAEGLCFGGGEE